MRFRLFVGVTCLLLASFNARAAFVSAKDILVSGAATGDGLYFIDPDGSGGNTPYRIYADMTTAGGGWTLGVHSLANSNAATTDMVANTGVAGLSTGHTRDLTHLAIDRDAEIRHRLVDFDGTVLFDGYYTGNYHGVLGGADDWTMLQGDANVLSYHFGRSWSTLTDDKDSNQGNCASYYGGTPWYYGSCWTTMPTNGGSYSTPTGYSSGDAILSYSIFARELVTPALSPVPVPAAAWLFASGLLGLVGLGRQRKAA